MMTADPYQFDSYYTEGQCDDDVNPITALRIKNAIDLNTRKMSYQKKSNGDLLIKYQVKNTSRKFIEDCVKDYSRFGGGEMCVERIVTYKEGTLIIDIIDTDTNKIIWHGVAYGPSFNSWKDSQQKIHEMVDALFQKYKTHNH